MRGSLIFNHMQVVDECRLVDSNSGLGGHNSPQPSPSNRQESLMNVPMVDQNTSFEDVVPGRSNSLSITEESPLRGKDRSMLKTMVPVTG